MEKYHLTYKAIAHPEGLTAEEVMADELNGGCTAILIGSLLYPEDGSYGAAFLSLDGRTGEPLESHEVWKAWTMLAHQLAEDETLSPNKRELCQMVFGAVTEALRAARNKDAQDLSRTD